MTPTKTPSALTAWQRTARSDAVARTANVSSLLSA
jgi:hypothetical protein